MTIYDTIMHEVSIKEFVMNNTRKTNLKGKTKRFIVGATLIGGLAVSGARFIGRGGDKQDKQEKKTEKVIKKRVDFNKKYKIETREDFDKLYNVAKPFIFASLIPSENWRPDFHSDKQKGAPNSVAVGLYYVGVDAKGNLDFSSTKEWKLTKSFYSNYKKKYGKAPNKLTPNQMWQGTVGWWENCGNGRHLKDLFNHLKGTELTINEFAAIASVYYNNETCGRKVCNYVRNHHDDPYDCAKYILKTEAPWKGHESRRVHETLLYLNFEGYCNDIYSLEIDGHLGTSITGGKPYRKILLKKGGFTKTNLHAAKEVICNYVVANGRPVKYWISQITLLDSEYLLMEFYIPNEVSKEMDKRAELYDQAMMEYDKKNYKVALVLFQKVIKEKGSSAELFNDMAITYYHLGNYKECVRLCDKAIATEESEFFMAAYYNKGLALMELGRYSDAADCFNKAAKLAKEAGQTEQKILYEKKAKQAKAQAENQKNIKPNKAPKFTKGKKKVAIIGQKIIQPTRLYHRTNTRGCRS